jgi:mannose-6-phosphate isomerase-like protein (cupin superfamily)
MRYVRPLDFSVYRHDGYEWEYLYDGESCRIIGSNVAPHSAAPAHHVHPVDQLYYVIHGEMQLQLGAERFTAGPNTLVFIPAGVPHHNWNEGDVDEFHFEVLAPTPSPIDTVMAPTDSTDAKGLPYAVRPLREDGFVEALEGFTMQKLLQRADGSEHVTLYVGEVAPGGAGPSTHVHEFDQFYYVLEGELTLEVALQRHTAGPHTLVVLPAGVPHRQWNEGPERERHITLIAPEPAGDGPWDVGVELRVTGEVHR